MVTLGQSVASTTALVAPWESMARCAALLLALKRRHLVVVDEGDRPIGLVRDLDVFRQGALLGDGQWVAKPHAKGRADEVQSRIDVIGLAEDPLERALDRLADSVQDVVVCVDAWGRLVGVLSEHDVMVVVSEHMPERLPVTLVANRPVVTAGLWEPAIEAFTTMLQDQRRHVVIVDRQDRVVGVVSIRDLFAAGVADGERRTNDEVRNVGEVHVLRPDDSLRRAATEMAHHRVGCLPVVDGEGRCVQVVSRTDLIRFFAAWLRDAVAVRVEPERRS